MKLQPIDNEDIEIDMSPMIDMVFLLLIFFLVASTVIDEKVPIKVPTAVHATLPETKVGRVTISVNEDDEIYFGVGGPKLTLDQLKQRVLAEIERDPKLRIQIRSGGGVKYEMSEKIMQALGEAGATDLIYAAYEGDPSEA
ncbi:MAG: biopolymer transporter ExbD [Verrucomicrobia bacterium]|nr:biopolymer transporter ExbD [Verrucomicrobiota bacterium]